MSLQRLRWLTIIVAIGFLVLVQGLAMGVVMPAFGRPYGHAVSITGFTAGIIVMATLLYNHIDRMQARIVHQNQESEALYEIAVDIAAVGDEPQVLRSIVDRAREMLGADAAALCLTTRSGEHVAAAHTGPPEAFCGHVPSTRAGQAPVAQPAVNGHCPLLNPSLSWISAELIAGGDRIGEISVSNPGSRSLGEDDLRLLRTMADLTAIEVQKGRLMERDRLVAVLEERERLAREMHDSLAQVLGYLHLKSEAAQGSLSMGNKGEVQEGLAEMSSVSHEAYVDVREAILGLRETISQQRGFVDALKEYAQKFSQQAGVSTWVDMRGAETLDLGPEAEVQLMRVIQEALTNVRKHAGALKACVRLEQRDGLRITIEDDGKGFDPGEIDTDRDRFGLHTMRERVERLGGRFEVDSKVGRGTRVCVVFSNHGG